MPIPQCLALLGDKLMLLKLAASQIDLSEIDSIVLKLSNAATATGMARTSLTGPNLDVCVYLLLLLTQL